MMSRWTLLIVYAAAGLALVGCGWLVPIYLRAVDVRVIERAGRNTPTLIDQGMALAQQGKFGSARLVLRAAEMEQVPGREKLPSALLEAADRNSNARFRGTIGSSSAVVREAGLTNSGAEPFTDFIIRQENREHALNLLAKSTSPAVEQILRLRSATNTVIFPASESSAGQALDAALSICGLLMEDNRLTGGLSNRVFALAAEANRTGNTQPFEELLADLMSLGQRFSWDPLAEYVGWIGDVETLHGHAALVRRAERDLPLLFAAVDLSGDAPGVARYLGNFSQTGWNDLRTSLRSGVGGVTELIHRDQRLLSSNGGWSLLMDSCLRAPMFALIVKWFLYLAGGFLLALALHLGRPAAPVLERPLQVRGFHVAREVLFALGFLLVVLLVSEPFLAQESQRVEFPLRLRLPTVGGAIAAGKSGASKSFMNHEVLLTMLLFFVLQALLYVASIVKLAEIRRQRVPSRVKLKLLENEDHLFDAGLYLGFVGTIISLILVSLGVFKQPSLMAAYSSTSFGIIFVSIFKILNLRNARRRLLLEAEAAPAEPMQRPAAHSLAAPL